MEEGLTNNNIWECLTCGQCSIYCPMTYNSSGVRIPELILELRKKSRENKRQSEKMLHCETHNNIFPLLTRLMADNPLNPNKLDFLDGINLKTAETGEIAYFVGCLPLLQDIFYNLDIKYVNSAITIITLLNEANFVPVVLNEKCCGHDILWGLGDINRFKKLAEYNVKLYRDAGVKTVILGCAEGYRTWKFDYPKVIDDFDFEVLHFSEFLLREKILENKRFPKISKIKVTYHDSCRLGRLSDKLYDPPRELLRQIPNVELIEMENIRDDAQCCGVSAFRGCNESTHFLRQKRIKEAIKTGADYLVVPCSKCLTHFTCYINEPSINKNKRDLRDQIKIVDLAGLIGRMLFIFNIN